VFWATDPLKGTFPAQAEAACTYFAEDQHVAYVVSGAVLPDDTMPACFAKHNLPLIWDYHYLLGRDIFDRYPNLYMPHMIGTYRSNIVIDGLNSAGYFDKGARIGLVRYDSPIHKEYADTVIKPGLKRLGLKLTDEAALKKPQSAGEAGDVANQAASAILRFSGEHIDHLIFVPSGGAIPLIWGNAADGQHFTPRNAFTSLDIPAFVTDNMSKAQLDRALVVGWMPANDTYMRYVSKTAALERCTTASGIKDNTGIVRYCDGLFFLEAALNKTPLFDVAGLRKAVEALGTSYASPWTISTRFGAGRHDGAATYQMMIYKSDCNCFVYEGAKRPAP